MTHLLEEAWDHGVRTKGNLARAYADELAAAASRGFLTTETPRGIYGRKWRITPAGLDHLWGLLGMDR